MSGLFSKFVIKGEKEGFLHSSGYAKAQNGGNMGAASVQSFESRMNMEKNRQKIRGYNDSRIAAQAGIYRPKAQTYTPPAQNDGGARLGGLGRGNSPKNSSNSR